MKPEKTDIIKHAIKQCMNDELANEVRYLRVWQHYNYVDISRVFGRRYYRFILGTYHRADVGRELCEQAAHYFGEDPSSENWMVEPKSGIAPFAPFNPPLTARYLIAGVGR